MCEKEGGKTAGCLYLCATPIGNLKDITLRVLSCLKEVDLIAAEDTRHTRKLLAHYGIKTPLFSYHQHSSPLKREELLSKITAGARVALVSDAGLPGVNDPGEVLVQEALARQLPLTVLPGPSAILTALLLSGFPTTPFSFLGFLAKENPRRQQQLQELAHQKNTVVFFESPHRLLRTLQELIAFLGSRPVAVAREMTKKFEEVIRGDALYVLNYFSGEGQLKGEFTLVVAPCEKSQASRPKEHSFHLLRAGAELAVLLARGVRKKEAATQVAARFNLSKKELYQLALQLDKEKIIPPSL